jgi:hypothetical protein
MYIDPDSEGTIIVSEYSYRLTEESDYRHCHYYGKAVPTISYGSHICRGRVVPVETTRNTKLLYSCDAHYTQMHYSKREYTFNYEDLYNNNDEEK